MSPQEPLSLDRLRQGFKKYFNPFMLMIFRLGLSRWFDIWPSVSGRIMIITHIGRKTGVKRRTPVNYAIVDGELYCTAGFGRVSDWYRNIKANPQVEVWLPDGWWAGVAEEVARDDRWLALMRQVIIGSGIAGSIFGLHPQTMSDEELQAAVADYCLIHIRRTEVRTGRGGPGDLAWVWPLATFILLPRSLRRRSNKRLRRKTRRARRACS